MTDTKEYHKEYYSRPDIKERHSQYMKDYYQKNKDQILDKQKSYYEKNKDKIRAYMKEYMRKYNLKKKEKDDTTGHN